MTFASVIRRVAIATAMAIALGLVAGHGATARAEPLDAVACEALAAEHAKLVEGGVKDAMAGGAQNARARLGAEKLAQVQRFITLDEQLLFRCGLHKIRFAPPPEPEEPAPDLAAAKASEKAQPAKAAPKPSPKPKPKPKPTSTDKGAPAAAKAQTATAPAPARKKPKVDDAYRPPAGTAAAPAASPVPRP